VRRENREKRRVHRSEKLEKEEQGAKEYVTGVQTKYWEDRSGRSSLSREKKLRLSRKEKKEQKVQADGEKRRICTIAGGENR